MEQRDAVGRVGNDLSRWVPQYEHPCCAGPRTRRSSGGGPMLIAALVVAGFAASEGVRASGGNRRRTRRWSNRPLRAPVARKPCGRVFGRMWW